MHARRFAALLRLSTSRADRRVAFAALAAGAASVLGVGYPFPAMGKPKKKPKKPCKKPNTKCGAKGCCQAGTQVCANGKCVAACQFTKTATTWTLKGNCTTTKTIEIPDGVTLDGNGKTVTPVGDMQIIRTKGASANVRNLTVDGAARCRPDSSVGPGLVFDGTSGQIQDVTYTDGFCGEGIWIDGSNGAGDVQVDIARVHLDGTGILYIGATGTVSNSTVRNAGTCVGVLDSDVSIDGNHLEAVGNGVWVLGSNKVSTASVTNNTIVGDDVNPGPKFGVTFLLGSPIGSVAGNVAGNTISNFKDESTGQTSCGISVVADAGNAVTIGANTFPDPPGNEQNICDFRE